MKNTLLYYYNIDIDEYVKHTQNIISFYIDYNKFYFIKLKRVKGDIEKLYDFNSKSINKYHSIIKNKYGSLFTEENNNNYVLIKLNVPENNEIELVDILKNQTTVPDGDLADLKRNNWSILWGEKIDYLEYQISELGKNHTIILNSFSYYVGLAENAIEYFNMINLIDNNKLVLAHKRIFYPNTSLNYYNPINLIVDYKVRDIGEYIKSKFFSGEDTLKEVKLLVEKNVLTDKEYNLLFTRLLYPSYYFDEVTSIIENQKEEDYLLKYVDKVNEYEVFLKKTFDLLSKKSNMIKINWIIKKES